MKHYLILIFIVLLKTSLLSGAFWWEDTKDIYPPAKVYFKDAEGVAWRIQSRLAESLFVVAPVKDGNFEDELLDTETFYLMQVNLDDSTILWREVFPKSYFKYTTCNGILLQLFYEENKKIYMFFLRDEQKWVKQEGLNLKNLDWSDYKDGILIPGKITGDPLVYFLSTKGLDGIHTKPVRRAPWLGEKDIVGMFTYEAGFQIFDLCSQKYYSLPKGYQPILCLTLQTIFVQEKMGLRRYAIYDLQNDKISFLKEDSYCSAVDGFYVIVEPEGYTHVYNSKGEYFRWPKNICVEQIRCSPHEILIVTSDTTKEYVNTTENIRRSFAQEDEVSIFDTFLKVKKANGEIFLIDLVTGENVPKL